ncbi:MULTISPECIES: hypothetical protein [unclassified Streptomyces]|uniref:hypothetical protein n=1 Tax=unclassified Streptomyces TaxID=2593676 RepID=UPI00117FB8D1|nr:MULTISPECIES: hypothetical protein [unclassified Streptomyces]
MNTETLLHKLAEEFTDEYLGDRPQEFHQIGGLTVVSALVFSSPDAQEWSGCDDVPAGTHPVHIGVVRRQDAESGRESAHVTMALIPFADPEAIAEAEFEDAIEDYQPLGPDHGFLWDSTAMDALRFDGPRPDAFPDLDAFVAHVESELATADAAGRIPAWVDVTVDERTGVNVLAFPVNAESAGCYEARDADGRLVALLFTAS